MRSGTAGVVWRSAVAAFWLVPVSFLACGGSALLDEPDGAAARAPAARTGEVTIPADVVAPVLSCGASVGSIGIQLPCELGLPPVSEVDCSLTGAAAGQKVAFMLGASLPAGATGTSFMRGTPVPFHATPLLGSSLINDRYSIAELMGTVTFTDLSFADRKLDGWFGNLTVLLTGRDGSIVPCSLVEGRFTAVPGDYL